MINLFKNYVVHSVDVVKSWDLKTLANDVLYGDGHAPDIYMDFVETGTLLHVIGRSKASFFKKSLAYISIKSALRYWRVYRKEVISVLEDLPESHSEALIDIETIIAMLDMPDRPLAVSEDTEDINELEETIFSGVYDGDLTDRQRMQLLHYLWNRKNRIYVVAARELAEDTPVAPPLQDENTVELPRPPAGMTAEEHREFAEARGLGWPET